MARPRVFVSSTYFDLKHIRSSLEVFIHSLGYDAVLSEKGDIPYTPEIPLDESCYREVQGSDIYVLIIGGRYGAEISKYKNTDKGFYDLYDSITRQEYKSAIEQDIPIYVLIEKSVYSEYHTFRKNRGNRGVIYAHVESINIFYFIEDIVNQRKNNPIQTFERHAEIETWLKEQWAGMFRELIQKESNERQISSLALQVNELAEMNKTFKRYLEALLSADSNPAKTRELISEETARLNQTKLVGLLKHNDFYSHLVEYHEIPEKPLIDLLKRVKNFKEFKQKLKTTGEIRNELISEVLSCRRFHTETAVFIDALKLCELIKPSELHFLDSLVKTKT